MAETSQLLSDYVRTGSESAFGELVSRYVDLVHSTAFRLVNGDSHRAEDVTQTVFADLARLARTLSPNVMLGGWLHRHTCFVASNLMRGERRRQNRERQAVEMRSLEDDSEADLTAVAPILDEAINQLGTADRQAIVLRFYEKRDFRSVGEALGSTEEAARKRVNRALEKLSSFFKRRGTVFSVATLGTLLSTHAVNAAPVGLATAVAASAFVGAAAVTTTTATTLTIFTIMNTKLKIGLVTTLVLAAAIPLVLQQKGLKEQRASETAALREQARRVSELEAENQRLAALAEQAKATPVAVTTDNEPSRELLAARGEAAKWRTAATAPKPSAMNALTSNPEMMKALRDQQKTALGMIYKDLAKELKLPKEETEKLNNMLADHVMTNITHICTLLAEGKSTEEMDRVFSGQESALLEQMRGLLGEEGLAQYQDYTRNLLGSVTAQQFKAMMTGDAAAKDAKTKQFSQLLQAESKEVLARAGLSPDFQLVPTLNFRNFTSEQEEIRNLKLLDEVYGNASTKAASFLSEVELEKFEEFRKQAQQSNKMILAMNRKLMSPQAP